MGVRTSLRRPHRSTKASLVIIKPCRHPEPRDCFTYRLPEGPRPCNLRRQTLAGRPYNAPRTYIKRFETVASEKIVCSAWAPICTSVDPATRRPERVGAISDLRADHHVFVMYSTPTRVNKLKLQLRRTRPRCYSHTTSTSACTLSHP